MSEANAATNPSRRPNAASSGRAGWLIAVFVLVSALPTLHFGFLEWDDPMHVTRNALVLAPERATLRDQLLTPALGYPIPVTVASYRLEHAVFGLAPWGYHLSNVLLHLLACLLALRLARQLGLSLSAAAVAVVLFALHPASAEPVSWISGRKDLLADAFGIAALLLALQRGAAARAGSVASYALALLCKPVVALLVPVLVTRDAWSTGALPPRVRVLRAVRASWPYLLVLAPIALLGVIGQRDAGALASADPTLSPARRALYALGHHARLALFLEPPTVKYLPSPWPPPFPSAVELTGGVLLALIAAALVFVRGPARGAARYGASFAALAYLPSSSALFPLNRYLADTYVHLPLLGLGIVLGATLDEALARSGPTALLRRLGSAAPWLLACALVPGFWLSSARFADDIALWSQARERYPHHARVCREWSNAVLTLRGPHAGLDAIDTCIGEFGDALFVKNRGLVLASVGRNAEARAWLERAARTLPGDPVVRRSLAALYAAPPSANTTSSP